VSLPLASTEAFKFGTTVGTVVAIGAVVGGTLAYLDAK